MLIQLREPCEINNVWAARLTDYIETKMQEVSCGEALYGFWHDGETICSQLLKTLLFQGSKQRAFTDAMNWLKEEQITAFVKNEKWMLENRKAVTP